MIKANFPARISFRVASKVDSRTILDSNGAEQLLGRGDMLFLPPGSSRLMRVHGPLVTEDEVVKVADFLKKQGKPAYNEKILESSEERGEAGGSSGSEVDELYDDALRTVQEMGKASTSALQRRLRIGYGRAAALLDAMERNGIIQVGRPTAAALAKSLWVEPEISRNPNSRIVAAVYDPPLQCEPDLRYHSRCRRHDKSSRWLKEQHGF